MNPYRTSPHAHAAPPAPMWPLWPVVLWLAFSLLAGCGPLTPTTATAIEGGDAIACQALTFVPVIGPVVAGLCAGEEALLTAALNAVLASQAKDAGAPDAGAKLAAASGPQTAVFQARAGKRVHVGYVPASLAVAVQAELDRRAAK